MPETAQNLQNHTRYVPLFHFVTLGLVTANLVRVGRGLEPFTTDSVLSFGAAVALALLCWYVRAFPLTVQDRVIRLEERLRLQQLAPELAARTDGIAVGQWTALRFASDAEFPELVSAVLDGKLTRSADIKRAIRQWRPDHLRV